MFPTKDAGFATIMFPRRPVAWHHALFGLQWLFMVCVSVIDGLLIVVYREDIVVLERNPVGRKILEWSGGNIGPFVVAKLACTLLVATLVLLLYWRKPRWGLPVVGALACFQFGLLLFLFFG